MLRDRLESFSIGSDTYYCYKWSFSVRADTANSVNNLVREDQGDELDTDQYKDGVDSDDEEEDEA